MNIKDSDRRLVLRALRERQMSKTQLAATMGVGDAWVTKFFNGKLKTLTPERTRSMETALGIQFAKTLTDDANLPSWLFAFHDAARNSPEIETIAHRLLELVHHPVLFGELRWFTTQELRDIGYEATRIVNHWEEGDDPHYARIGRELVEFISSLAAKHRVPKAAEDPATYDAGDTPGPRTSDNDT